MHFVLSRGVLPPHLLFLAVTLCAVVATVDGVVRLVRRRNGAQIDGDAVGLLIALGAGTVAYQALAWYFMTNRHAGWLYALGWIGVVPTILWLVRAGRLFGRRQWIPALEAVTVMVAVFYAVCTNHLYGFAIAGAVRGDTAVKVVMPEAVWITFRVLLVGVLGAFCVVVFAQFRKHARVAR